MSSHVHFILEHHCAVFCGFISSLVFSLLVLVCLFLFVFQGDEEKDKSDETLVSEGIASSSTNDLNLYDAEADGKLTTIV